MYILAVMREICVVKESHFLVMGQSKFMQILYFTDPYSPFTRFGRRVAASLGGRRGAQRLRPGVLQLQDRSQVE